MANQQWDIPTWTAEDGRDVGAETTFYDDGDGFRRDKLYNGDAISGTRNATVTEGTARPGGL